MSERLAQIIFSDSHGAVGRYLGAGFFYFAFAAALRSQVSVCIGSGGGFVPALLAQAQQTVGVSPAITYLIDANLGELGFGSPVQSGGWMHPDSDLHSIAPEIAVLPMLSADGADLLAAQGIQIDYLHIDGDHSTLGVITDFESFLPLLTDCSVVILHDTSKRSVSKAVKTILERHPGWQFIDFPKLGDGTAFLRAPDGDLAERPGMAERRVRMAEHAIEVATAVSAQKAKYERWSYLRSTAYLSRYRIVAPEIDEAGVVVVEVGGFPNSIASNLIKASTVIAIEPYAPPDFVARIAEHAAEKGIDYQIVRSPMHLASLDQENWGAYHLVALGLDFMAACETAAELAASITAFLRLARGAQIVAVEFPSYEPSIVTWGFLRDALTPEVKMEITLDLSKDPIAADFAVTDRRSLRTIIVFKPGQSISDGEPDRIIKTAENLHRIKVRGITASNNNSDSSLFEAADLPFRVGRLTEDSDLLARPGHDEAGCLSYGPYVRLRPRRYRVTACYASPASPTTVVGDWDACARDHVLWEMMPLGGTAGLPIEVTNEFTLSQEASRFPVEIRTYFRGEAEIRLRYVRIEYVPPTTEPDA